MRLKQRYVVKQLTHSLTHSLKSVRYIFFIIKYAAKPVGMFFLTKPLAVYL